MKFKRARSLAAAAYATFDTELAGAALEILRHRPRRDRVASGLAALVKGGGANVLRSRATEQPLRSRINEQPLVSRAA